MIDRQADRRESRQHVAEGPVEYHYGISIMKRENR
jgi:hypothetical protein